MGLTGYDLWSYDTLRDDYDASLIKYSGDDMDDAYQSGLGFKERNDNLEQENRALRQLLGANVRVLKEEIRRELAEEKEIKE